MRGPRRYVMSQRGNDLVRRYLWMAALSAVRFNPAVRALFARLAARRPDRKAAALGQCMTKLLHPVFALWKSDRPFDLNHYPWAGPDGAASNDKALSLAVEEEPASDKALSVDEQAAGHKPELKPAEQVVTAACAASVAETESVGETTALDFAHLKRQLPLLRVFEHLGLSARLARGHGPQRRCACQLHRGDGRGRTLSVNLDANVFHCFDKSCGAKGDVIDLWSALRHLTLREAAIDLVQTFELEPTPPRGTEKRHG